MKQMSNPEPLWRVMRDAYGSCAAHQGTQAAIAAEIRALVEARLPEEPWQAAGPCDVAEGIRREERQRLRRWLLADAEEAEAGQ